jgi:predicted metal-binding membrane protein
VTAEGGSGAFVPSGHPAGARVNPQLPLPAALLLLTFGVIIAVAWVVTVLTANDLMTLLGNELTGPAPIAHLDYFALTAVMMTAMMLPSAVPMVSVYRRFALADSSPREGNARVALFALSYLLVWAVFAAVVLVVVMGLGLMGGLTGWIVLVPGAILIAAGTYQFTTWKRYCLEGCQSPFGFFLTRWRPGRQGAVRMGLAHSYFCLGCCWLLMLVVFVSGAMSLLWMGSVTGLVLLEKVWGNTTWVTRGIGLGTLSVGVGVSALAIAGAYGLLL